MPAAGRCLNARCYSAFKCPVLSECLNYFKHCVWKCCIQYNFYDKWMGLTLFSSAKNTVSHMKRDKLKMLRQECHTQFYILNLQFCIIKYFLLVASESNKTIHFSPGNFHIFRHSILLTEGHVRENSLLPTSFQSPDIALPRFTVVPNKHLNCGWDTVQIQFCVYSIRIAKCEKCNMGLCIPSASGVPYKGEI
jgi:hypothetical protein